MRAHRIKKILGMLPTQNLMHARLPSAYADGYCRRCGEEEDNNHIWTCHESKAAQENIWFGLDDKLAAWTEDAIKKTNKPKKKRRGRANGGEAAASGPPSLNTRTRPTLLAITEALSNSIHGVSERLEEMISDRPYSTPPVHTWSVRDLYCGLTQLSLIDTLKNLLHTSQSIATKVAHKVVEYMGRKPTKTFGSRDARLRSHRSRCSRSPPRPSAAKTLLQAHNAGQV
ncbi:hypothetical protein DFQ26_008729, partial [Actinomortierella ambigua]